MSDLLKLALAVTLPKLTGSQGKQRLSILIYHQVVEVADYMRESTPTVEQFDQQMELLARYFRPVSLADALELMDKNELPERAVCVTFDDGYADNAELALPILRKWAIPATVFVSTGFLDGGIMWNDTVIEAVKHSTQKVIDLTEIGLGSFGLESTSGRRDSAYKILGHIKHLSVSERQRAVDLVAAQSSELSGSLMLTTEQLIDLHQKGVEIGAHTHNHPILTSLSLEEARQEIEQNRMELEATLGQAVRFFAYPNGKSGKDYMPIHQDMVHDMGFQAALSTDWGVSSKRTDRWQMPRFTPWDTNSERFLLRLLWNLRRVVE